MNVPANIKARVEAKLRESIALAEKHYGQTFKFPRVEYSVRGTCGGKAYTTEWRVNFNATLLVENEDKFIATTVPHEMAHLIDYQLNPNNFHAAWGKKRSIHGPTWKRIMMVLGAPPNRCHTYDTKNSRVKQKTRYEWVCQHCGAKMVLGPKRHKKQKQRDCYRPRNAGCNWSHTYKYVGIEGQVLATAANNPTPPKSTNKKTTKQSKANAIYQRMAGSARKDVIVEIIAQLGVGAAHASTLYANAKKRAASGT